MPREILTLWILTQPWNTQETVFKAPAAKEKEREMEEMEKKHFFLKFLQFYKFLFHPHPPKR